jgi:hypothetical protein
MMSIPSLCAVLCLVLVGFAEGQSKGDAPQRIGDLLVELTPGTSTPSQLIPGLPTPPPGRYWIVAEVRFRNAGNLAVCASFAGTIKAEQGLDTRTTPNFIPPISGLMPGEEARRDFIFSLKRGVDPLDLRIEAVSYEGGGCRTSLPGSAAKSAQFIMPRGVSSPKGQ